MKSIIRTTALTVTLLAPAFAQASLSGSLTFTFGSGCASGICTIASNFVSLINNILVPLLFAVSFIVFLYGIAKAYIFSHGEPDAVKEGHKLLLWGLIGFVVMISIWGLVNVIASSFGLDGFYAPLPPSSIPI